MTSVEVLAARDMVRSLPVSWARERAIGGLNILVEEAREWEKAAADALAAAEKAEAEAAELAAYGGIAGAEAGWNALRQHNPKVDRSSGVQGPEGEVQSFNDLSHKQKLNYAAFAFGVLNPGAKLGSPVSEEPHQFKVGDRVRITGPLTSHGAGDVDFEPGQIVTILDKPDENGDVEVGYGEDYSQWIDPASLTLVTEPREWETAEQVPIGVKFTHKSNKDADYWVRESDHEYRWHSGSPRKLWGLEAVDHWAPHIEVIA